MAGPTLSAPDSVSTKTAPSCWSREHTMDCVRGTTMWSFMWYELASPTLRSGNCSSGSPHPARLASTVGATAECSSGRSVARK